MPRKPVASKKKGSRSLTFDEEVELIIGCGGKKTIFDNEEQKKMVWNRHKERLIYEMGPGHRPDAWWKYDAPEPRKIIDSTKLDEPLKYWVKDGNDFENYTELGHFEFIEELNLYEDDFTYLQRLELLEEWEIAELKRRR